MIAPPGSGPGACEAATLREALALAIGSPQSEQEHSPVEHRGAGRLAA